MGKLPNLPENLNEAREAIYEANVGMSAHAAVITSASHNFASYVERLEQQAKEIEERAVLLQEQEAGIAIRRRELSEREAGVHLREQRLAEQEESWREMQEKVALNASKLASVIQINVGGQIFEVPKSTLLEHKGSYFEAMLSADTPQLHNDKFFIDHNPKHFQVILDFMRTKKIRKSDMMFKDELMEDFEFFGIPFPISPDTTRALPLSPPPSNSLLASPTIENLPFTPPPNDPLAFPYAPIQQWLPSREFSLLYKGTRDGFGKGEFHKICDHKGPTITIIHTDKGYLFGGYAPIPWGRNKGYDTHPSFFLFTLCNPHNLPPTQYALRENACGLHNAYNATFGSGHDIYISDRAKENAYSYSHFGTSFIDTTGKGPYTFTGERNFGVKEVEVYRVI